MQSHTNSIDCKSLNLIEEILTSIESMSKLGLYTVCLMVTAIWFMVKYSLAVPLTIRQARTTNSYGMVMLWSLTVENGEQVFFWKCYKFKWKVWSSQDQHTYIIKWRLAQGMEMVLWPPKKCVLLPTGCCQWLRQPNMHYVNKNHPDSSIYSLVGAWILFQIVQKMSQYLFFWVVACQKPEITSSCKSMISFFFPASNAIIHVLLSSSLSNRRSLLE